MKTFLGTLPIEDANRFAAQHASVFLGSMSKDGGRRVFTTAAGDALLEIRILFADVPDSQQSIPKPSPVQQEQSAPDPEACIHRGAQRMAACCGGGRIDQWICRAIKQPDGKPVDCVRTLSELTRNRAAAGKGNEVDFDRSIVSCEGCERYQLKTESTASIPSVHP